MQFDESVPAHVQAEFRVALDARYIPASQQPYFIKCCDSTWIFVPSMVLNHTTLRLDFSWSARIFREIVDISKCYTCLLYTSDAADE